MRFPGPCGIARARRRAPGCRLCGPRPPGALAEDGGAGGQALGLVQVVGAQDHGAGAAQRAQDFLHVVALNRVEAPGGLVHDHQIRVVKEALGQGDALLEALGEIPDGPVRHGFERESAHLALDRPAQVGAAQPPGTADEAQERRHPQLRVEARGLHHQTQPRLYAGGVGGRRDAVDRDVARARQQASAHDPDQGGLAGAVGTQQAEALAGFDVQGHSGEGQMVAEAACEAARFHPCALGGAGFGLAQFATPLADDSILTRLWR